MKLRFKTLWLVLAACALILLAAGCNDTLRQFITPVPSPTGDPGTLSHAIALSTNPAPSSVGSDMHIDISGDTSAGIVPVGPNPVFLGKNSSRVFIINSGSTTPTVVPPTVSVYTALLGFNATVSTVTLPTTGPDAVVTPVAGATSSSNDIFIANQGSDSVSVISGTVLAVTKTIHLVSGAKPVSIAGNAANNKIFVVNNGAGSVSEISTIDDTFIKDITVGVSPIWGVMSTDGLFVFVVNQGDGTVSVIDTSLESVIATIAVGASPNFAFYEPKLKRVYVSNTGANTVSVIQANITTTTPPAKLADIVVSGAPTSVTALSDGTKAYAALGNCASGTNHLNIITNLAGCTGNLVSVIDAVALREAKTITVGSGAISIDAASDASKVFVVNAHDSVTDASGTHTAGTISDIRTSTGLEIVRKTVPQQDPNCKISSTVSCPSQTPFMVRTFP